MAEPTTGTGVAAAAIIASQAATAAVIQQVPQGTTFGELAWSGFYAMAGAFCMQFVAAFEARQKAARKGIPNHQRPKIDLYILAYAMAGAPLASSLFIYLIHLGHGSADGPYSVPGFMAAGAFAPVVIKAGRRAFSRMLGDKEKEDD